jgi:hypothetical protein
MPRGRCDEQLLQFGLRASVTVEVAPTMNMLECVVAATLELLPLLAFPPSCNLQHGSSVYAGYSHKLQIRASDAVTKGH